MRALALLVVGVTVGQGCPVGEGVDAGTLEQEIGDIARSALAGIGRVGSALGVDNLAQRR